MKRLKNIVYFVLFLSCSAVVNAVPPPENDRQIITQALLCQNAPVNPSNQQLSDYVNETTKVFRYNSGPVKAETVDDIVYYALYPLKKPIIINGIKFGGIEHIEEYGYVVFRSTGIMPKNNQFIVIEKFSKAVENTANGLFEVDVKKREDRNFLYP